MKLFTKLGSLLTLGLLFTACTSADGLDKLTNPDDQNSVVDSNNQQTSDEFVEEVFDEQADEQETEIGELI